MPTKRKATKPKNPAPLGGAVDAYLKALDHPLKEVVVALRQLLLELDSRIQEEVKWNAPSFFIDEHFATFRLGPPSAQAVQVVLHTGARVRVTPAKFLIEDPVGLLTWPAKDRCVASFRSTQEVTSRHAAFAVIVQAWIAQLPRDGTVYAATP